MITVHGQTFQIKARGQNWSGVWRVEGKDVCVDSAFGSVRVAKGRRGAVPGRRVLCGGAIRA